MAEKQAGRLAFRKTQGGREASVKDSEAGREGGT